MTEETSTRRLDDWLLLAVGVVLTAAGVGGIATMPDPQTGAHYALGAGIIATAVGLKRTLSERAQLIFTVLVGKAFLFIAAAKLFLPPVNVLSVLVTGTVGYGLILYAGTAVYRRQRGATTDA